MPVTATYSNMIGTVHTLNAAASRGQGWTRGTINASGVSYAGGGITCTMPFIVIEQVQLEPRFATSTSLFYGYDISNTKVIIYTPQVTTTAGAVVMAEVASDTALSSLTAIRFVAWGHD